MKTVMSDYNDLILAFSCSNTTRFACTSGARAYKCWSINKLVSTIPLRFTRASIDMPANTIAVPNH